MNKNHNIERCNSQYWIDRSGKIHKYKGSLNRECVSIHYEIVNTLFPDVPHAKQYVEKLGWCMVGSTVYSTPIIEIKPSQAQINTLDKLGLYDRLCIPYEGYMINYKENESKFQ